MWRDEVAELATMKERGKPERKMCSVCNVETDTPHFLTQCIEVFKASEMKALVLSAEAERKAINRAADLCEKMYERLLSERGHLVWMRYFEELRQQILALKGK
jgi:hypothetical protein